MHPDSRPIPIFPRAPAMMTRFMPLAPLSLSLTRVTQRIARHHPGLFRRLGEYGHARFILDPTDLPFVLYLEPRGGAPRVTVLRHQPEADARIAGPLAALIGLVHGAFDGDALFFSRDLVIEGNTAAALALRNAIDDAELDLCDEIEAMSGRFARPARRTVILAERATGVALSRPQEEVY